MEQKVFNVKNIKMFDNDNYFNEKKQIEKEIIETLHNLYTIYLGYERKEQRFCDIYEKKRKYIQKTSQNVIKSTACVTAATIAGAVITKGDANIVGLIPPLLGTTALGTALFQFDTNKDYHYDEIEYYDAAYDFDIQNQMIEEYITTFMIDIIKYIPYHEKEMNWESISTEIFTSNKEFVEKQIENNEYNPCFERKTANETLEYYIDGRETIDKAISSIKEILDETVKETTTKQIKIKKRLRK